MSTVALQFGTYTFPAGFYLADDGLSAVVPTAKLPRGDGARALTGTLDGKRISVRGGFIKGLPNASDLRDRIDALRLGTSGGAKNLYLYSDRYWRNVQRESIRDSYEATGPGRIVDVEVDFFAPDPYQYSTSETTDNWAPGGSGQSKSITAGGGVYARPVMSITVGGVGTQTIAFTITNTTTNKSFTLTGSVVGTNLIEVDGLNQTVKIGTTSRIDLFDGVWPRLEVGANTITEVYTAGSIANIATSWRNRWE